MLLLGWLNDNVLLLLDRSIIAVIIDPTLLDSLDDVIVKVLPEESNHVPELFSSRAPLHTFVPLSNNAKCSQ